MIKGSPVKPEKLLYNSWSGELDNTICAAPRGGVGPAALEKGSVNIVTSREMNLKHERPYQIICMNRLI